MTNGGRHDSLKTLSQVNTIVTIPAYFIVTILSIIKMFIETLEFTIPVELCSVFSNLQKAQKSNVEFPASVNSYGTTQDANIQVVLRSNKLTFKVDGVSSNSSMISKSECKTLKLSVFDVDSTLLPQEEEQVEEYNYNNSMSSIPVSVPSKRLLEQSVSLPPAKSSRTSYNNDSPRPRSPQHRRSPPRRSQNYVSPRPSENSQPKPQNDTPVNVKQEPEDPDLIEIEPDEIELKKETPYMQIDYSSDVPHTQTSQSALERLSHPQSSHSQSPYYRNVPHVPDYTEPGRSQDHQGDQSADDFLVFQDQEDNEDCDNNDVEYGNDGSQPSESLLGADATTSVATGSRLHLPQRLDFASHIEDTFQALYSPWRSEDQTGAGTSMSYKCRVCSKVLSETDKSSHTCTVCDTCNMPVTRTPHLCTRFYCTKCKRQYATQLYLARHRCSYCCLCDTILSTYQKYQQHIEKIHGIYKAGDDYAAHHENV